MLLLLLLQTKKGKTGGRAAGIKRMLQVLCGAEPSGRGGGGGDHGSSGRGGGGILDTYYNNAAVRPLMHLCFCLCL